MTFLVVLTLVIVACGGGAESTATPTSRPTSPPTLAPTATPQALAATPTSLAPTLTSAPTATSRPTATQAPPTATQPPKVQPKKGGVFLVPEVGLLVGREQDPHKALSVRTQIESSAAYDVFVRMMPPSHLTVGPWLFESWTFTPDGLNYTFKVRDGVKFHNGAAMTVDDVAFSINRIVANAGVGALTASMLSDVVDRVDIVDPRTVRITLKFPAPSFLERLAFPLNVVVPKSLVAPLDATNDFIAYKTAIGTGPFRSAKEDPGVQVEWSRNPNYWAKDADGNQLPYLDTLRILQIADQSAAVAALRTGQVHITRVGAGGLRPNDVDIVRKTLGDKVTLYTVNIWAQNRILVNVTKAPWNDVRVRRAINLAIDRQTMTEFFGKEFTSISGPLPAGDYAIPPDELLKLPGYRPQKDEDIVQAKSLLKAAGIPDGFQYTAISSSSANDVNVVMVDQMARIGLKHNPLPLSSNVRPARDVAGDFDMSVVNEAYPLNDPDFILRLQMQTNGANNYGRFSSPEIDAIVDKVSRELDLSKRKALVKDWQMKELDLSYPINTFWLAPAQATWNFVHGWTLGPGVYNGWSDYDIVWLNNR